MSTRPSASLDVRRLDPVQILLIITDDTVLMKQIQETHAPDGREIDCLPLLRIIEEILYRATPLGIQEAVQKKPVPSDADNAMLDALSYVVSRISSEMAYKCSASGDAHATAVSLLQLLSSYPWEAKLVLLLAAFVLNYGEFWLLLQIHASSKLARKIAIVKQVPELEILKQQLGPLNNLIMLMLDLAKCILGYKDLPPESINLPELSTALGAFPAAIYWATRGIVTCAAHTTLQTALNYDYTTLGSGTLEKELNALADKIESSNERLQKQLTLCYQIIEEKKENDAYEMLAEIIEKIHIDNMKVLRALISTNEDEPPLFEGSTKRMVNLDVLRRKYVLFLISGLINPISYELAILSQIYVESKTYSGVRSEFEIVWIPIVESLQISTDATQQNFVKFREAMPWCSVTRLSSISKPVIKFIRQKFRYRNLPILVVLDPQGRVSSLNAFYMMWIWGSFGFPFTKLREEALWREEIWRLELIVNGIDVDILQWIRSGNYIILYGGDDIQWINEFTATARRVVAQAGIPLEMIYVGKGGKSEQEMKPLIETINRNRLSNCFEEVLIWYFWTRLDSMLFSKIQLETDDEQDPVMQEIEKLLMYDGIGAWALFSRGPDVIFTGHGPAVLQALKKFDEWKENVKHVDFLDALKEQYNHIHGDDHPCCSSEFNDTVGVVPKKMICPECHRFMEQYAIYSCCHEP